MIDILSKYEELLTLPISLEDRVARRNAIDKAIEELMKARSKIQESILEECTHYVVVARKVRNTDPVEYIVQCSNCTKAIYIGTEEEIRKLVCHCNCIFEGFVE